MRNINIRLVCLDHRVVGVGDGDKYIARKNLVVCLEQAETPVRVLLTPEDGQLFVILAREHHVDIVVPRHKAALPQRSDQTAADQPEGEVVFFAEFLEVDQRVQLLQLQLTQQPGRQLDLIHSRHLYFLVFSFILTLTSSICCFAGLFLIFLFQKGICSNPTSVPKP